MRFFFLLLSAVIITGCGQSDKDVDTAIFTDANILHANQKQLTEVIIYDVFSPPVASRIYAYTSLAAYEALRFAEPGYPSLTAQLYGFPEMPKPEEGKSFNYLLASTQAFFTVAKKLTFSIDTLKKYEDRVFNDFKSSLDKDIYKASLQFGEEIGKAILERTKVDNYLKTRGMPKYIGVTEEGKWQPTPPDYNDGMEPNWAMILPLAMDSCTAFRPLPPPLFSRDTNSFFHKIVLEVYNTTKNLTPEQLEIAKYWDDNPFVMEHSGHLMFANKKITPVGHWIGIAGIACKMNNTPPIETTQIYALTAVGIFDGFISCWEEKFRNHLVRPITVINEQIDRNWQPVLQTPPFPEHTSGHSTISAAAATILTHRFGDNFAFEDTSDYEYIGMKRKFPSFFHAAQEASISRLYGGIHYRTGIEEGARQGAKIGEYINNKIQVRDSTKAIGIRQ